MRYTVRCAVLFALSAGLVAWGGSVGGQDKKAEEKKADGKKADGKAEPREPATPTTPETKAFEALRAAETLAKLGRDEKTKSPLLLLAAARVIGTTPVQKLDQKDAKLESKGSEYNPLEEAAALIKAAREMGGADAAVKALADAVEKDIKEGARGAAGGAKVWNGYLQKGFNTTDDYYCTFISNQPAFVEVKNLSNTGDIDLYIYDNNTGALIGRDIKKDDDAFYSWFPSKPTNVRIRIRAYAGNAPMKYSVRTN